MFHARFVRSDHVQVPLHNHHALLGLNGRLSQMQPIQDRALVIHRRLRRVHILGIVFWIQNAARKPDHRSMSIMQRHHEPMSEPINQRASLGLKRQPRLHHLAATNGFLFCCLQERVPSLRRIPESKLLHQLGSNAAPFHIGKRLLARLRLQILGIHRLRVGIDRLQALGAVGPLAIVGRQLHTCLARQVLERFTKLHSLHLHHEREDVAPFIAAKTMPNLLLAIHMKRRCLLAMKRTQSLIRPLARTLER